ncbi:carboxymuconolactone decarboxylase family protein [Thiocapsa bogorovii]|uniref:carboxymuconolactone decarboxylase family protein n=1 Tax=Thiocapsa bogorovii TaxID=521689 RepID=UPI001E6025CA|nr:carboxymuconolactone decarboxylase family protein [Thiocapsa bogorovii]UHD18721.1 carboxymuconolactone decarboxylase family protein [Thiocapsa bogorovii]
MIPFQLHDMETAPQPSRAIMADMQRHGGELPNLLRTLAEAPVALEAYRQLATLLSRSSLTPIEQQVVYVTAAHTNQCHYCTTPNPLLGGDIQADQLAAAIRHGQRLADVRLQALRRFTAAMTEHRGWVPEADVESFLRAGFTRENLLEVITGIALVTLSSYANHVSATPVDDLAA